MPILSTDLVKQFVESTHDETETKEPSRFYGTASVRPDGIYVMLDGSTIPTPVSMATDAQTGDRVLVEIVDHQARVIQNINKSNSDIVAGRIEHDETGVFQELRVGKEYVDTLIASDITADSIVADRAKIEDLEADNATITGKLTVAEADIKTLETTKLSAEDADIRYLNVDFSKIDKAWLQEFYAQSGIIKDLVIGESTVTGHLVGVTISGDLIEGNTVKADKLVIKGEDGLYYKLNIEGGSTVTEQLTKEMLQNGLDGNNIIVNTITAEKISVDDLIAFDATIGGFNIGINSIYSGVKDSINNTTRGIYLDNEGQLYFGDDTNYIRYYKAADGKYKLAVSAETITFGTSGKGIEEALQDSINSLEIGGRNLAISSLNFDRRELIYNTSGTNKGVEIIEYDDRTAIKFTGENTVAIMGCYLITPYTVTVEDGVITGSNVGDDTFIISFDYKCESSLQTHNFQLRLFSYDDSADTYANAGYIVSTTWPIAQLTATSNWKRVKTGVLNINNPIALTSTGTLTGTFAIGIGYVNNPGVAFEMSKIKLEKGNKATDWTPALEDVDADIDNAWEKADDAQTSIDNLEIGGRNLLIGSEKGVVNTNADTSSWADLKLQVYNGKTYVGLEFRFGVTAGEHIEYTYTSQYSGDRVIVGDNGGAYDGVETFLVSEYKEGVVYTLSCDVIDDRPNVVGGYVLKNIKLEKGNKATDWTPAPEDIDSRTTVLEAASAKELVRNGFAEFTNDPKLTLGKTTSPWKVVVKNDGIFLQKSSNDVASLSKETSSEETTLRADNARLANVKFRSANGGGKIGIVAQSNGHVSLKEI